MIKFFRHIRKSLLKEDKTTKSAFAAGRYLKYALGEIILVVIGILLALQVNNWNEKRLDKKKEQLLLNELHQEFKNNKKQFTETIYMHKRAFKSVNYIKSQLPINLAKANLDSLSYHLYYMGWIYTFNPSKGVTNSLTNSATFNLISNDTLRKLLVSWNDILLDYQEEELRAYNNYVDHLKPFEKKHFYFSTDYEEWLRNKKVDLQFLQTLEFDNYVLDRYNDLNEILNNQEDELLKISTAIDQIITLSKPSTND